MSDFKERLESEVLENSEKMKKLESFIDGSGFANLCAHPQSLLEIQLVVMGSLDVILRKRLKLLE